MRSTRTGIAAVALLLWSGSAGAAAEVGRLAAVRGHVTVDRAPARNGTPVFATSVVESGHGKATVLLGSSFVLHLGENSRLEIKNFVGGGPGGKADRDSADVTLGDGKMRALVRKAPEGQKRFTIRSKAAVMGVRGTEVYVSASGSSPFFLTVSGLADLSLPGPGGAGPPNVMNLGPLQGFRNGARVTLTSREALELIRDVAPPRRESFTESELGDEDEGGDDEGSGQDELEDFRDIELDPFLEDHSGVILEPTSRKL